MSDTILQENLIYLINHVFMPLRLPLKDDHSLDMDWELCNTVLGIVEEFRLILLDDTKREVMGTIATTLKKLLSFHELVTPGADVLAAQMNTLEEGGVLVIPIRAQNACVIVRKGPHLTVFEIFEVDPPNSKTMGTMGKVIRSFPDKAVAVPTNTLNNSHFQGELASFLAQMDVDVLDSAATTKKGGTDVKEPRDTAHPHYITDLLFSILRGLPGAGPANVFSVQKRVGNDVVWNNAYLPWRRSPLWLILRVTIQTTVCLLTGSNALYKSFMVYFTSQLLHQAVEINLPSHLLHCLRAKVARRLSKLKSIATDALINGVFWIVQGATQLMETRWDKAQEGAPPLVRWSPKNLDILGDTQLSLLKSIAYIKKCRSRVDKPATTTSFQPIQDTRIPDSLSSPVFASRNLASALSTNRLTTLLDFEQSVQAHLDNWIQVHWFDNDTSTILSSCIETYAAAAQTAYKGSPEDLSVMFLTVFDLWVALDKVAIIHHNMLREYSPEVPTSLLNPLLLRSARSIERYGRIQAYIRERHQKALGYSIFDKSVSPTSFAVRYFEESNSLRSLRQRIEQDAELDKWKALSKLENKKRVYQSRLDQAESMEHLYRLSRKGWMFHDTRACKKCRKETSAKEMELEVYEWPLSSDSLQARLTVFELCPPPVFRNWRRTTYTILFEYCRPGLLSEKPESPEALLETYPGLAKYASGIDRITLGSPTKSFGKSHYKSVLVSQATPENLILPNGLKLQPFDSGNEQWIVNPFADCKIESSCTPKIPQNSPYKNLQYAVSGVTHSSNQVIVDQYTAPPELSLHEHIAFGTLRAGAEIQWLNILRELHAQTLSLDRLETQMLLLQASSQVGECNGFLKWHQDLRDPAFGRRLLLEIGDVMTNIRENWLHLVSLETLVRLISRLLASNTDTQVIDLAYEKLRTAREIAYRWVSELSKRLQNDTDDDIIAELQSRLCVAALVCRATYDADETHLRALLKDDEDIATLLECLIRAHDNTPSDIQPGHLQDLISRDRRLSHRTHRHILDRINRSAGACLNLAVGRLWTTHSSNSFWDSSSLYPHEWFTTRSFDGRSHIHLNLMNGTLFINGKPLNRLPQYILQHATYKRLFGKQILEVVPSNRPYMEFCTRGVYPGTDYNVHFGMINGELIVQASNHSEVYELIPHTILWGDFPEFLVLDFFHWLRLTKPSHDTSELFIEFRPLATPWESSNANWALRSSPPGRFHLERTTDHIERLVDIRSRSFIMFVERLKPLEHGKYMIMTTRISEDRYVLLDLPRHRLSFLLNEEYQLESCDLREMVVDDAPSGCMFGLRNQLILRPKNALCMHLARARCVLIPCGQIAYQTSGHHVDVTIDTGDDRHVRYFKYDIDTNLGCLTLPGQSLEAEYYKIYLHALTSHCLPDPLTGRTGTEEALAELSSAKCRSFPFLGDKERDLLFLIAGLAPAREWYPPHLKSMQVVHWRDNLSPLSQHWGFFILSRDILDFAEKLTVFRPHESGTYAFPASTSFASDDHLRDRAALRGAHYFTLDYAYIEEGAHHDRLYILVKDRARHQTMSSDAAAKISALVQQWPLNLTTVPNLWNRFCDANQLICGTSSLSYDATFFLPKVSELWIPMYNACSQENQGQEEKMFALTFSLAALAYTSPNNGFLDIISTLLAFAVIREFKDLPIPQFPSCSEFDLTRGTAPDRAVLLSLIRGYAIPFEDTHFSDVSREDGETEKNFARRRRQALSKYSSACKDQVTCIVDNLVRQWSGQTDYVSEPSIQQTSYFTPAYMDDVRTCFKHWFRNSCLRDHVVKLQRLLDRSRSSHLSRPSARNIQPEKQFSLRKFNGPTLVTLNMPRSLQTIATSTNCPVVSSSVMMPPRLSSLGPSAPTNLEDLTKLIQKFRLHKTKLHELYAGALENSAQTFLHEITQASSTIYMNSHDSLLQLTDDELKNRDKCLLIMIRHLIRVKRLFDLSFETIFRALEPSDMMGNVVSMAGCWPRITTRTILQLLSHKNRAFISTMPRWEDALVLLGKNLVRLQQAQRCVKWAIQGSFEELEQELRNETTDNDKVMQDPEWLLTQIESDFMARPLQEKVTLEMISPSSQKNTLLQLNMGEGKTSVIVPLVAARLADKEKLVRVIVLKPLKNQMFASLVSRLGGLVNRRIFYLPFSRDIQIGPDNFHHLDYLLTLCRVEGGILVAQPEHILSLKLMSIHMMITSEADKQTAIKLRQQQSWLRKFSRDILDESDEIMSVEYQLVYTDGQQVSLEHNPFRWILVQHVLGLVRAQALVLSTKSPLGLELQNDGSAPDCFPVIRILDDVTWTALANAIGKELINGLTSEFRFCSVEMRHRALEYITDLNVATDQQEIKSSLGPSLWAMLLLYRGLLAYGILKFTLKQKRWRVDYGLDPTRTLLAVPYKAKDVPSPRADFGHPDVALILTCLSYYYSGLTDEQVALCFEMLFKLDNPALEYENWTRNHVALPEWLRQITGVNWRDVQQRQQYLLPLFRRAQPVINFYLSSVVFPKEAKQFQFKLSTSAWDLSERTVHVKTGFSGTNDNQYLLPTMVHQLDPVNQLGTNAKVVIQLLRAENNFYKTYGSAGESFSGRQFLKMLTRMRSEVRVLLDVGAQMLDMRNDELVKHWLSICSSRIQAAVFFNDSNDMCIMTRDGNVVPFSSSPFNERLDVCIVYLDDAHTRGTDLKLPPDTRAAVTLGPKVTKDRLVQGCMRMRKLGHGHSVVFFAPPEIDRKIRTVAKKSRWDDIESSDVLLWAMSETCDRIAHYIGHWAHQGTNYMKRLESSDAVTSEDSPLGIDVAALRRAWLEPEARTLEDMYAAKATPSVPHGSFTIPDLRKRLLKLGADVKINSLLDEEQEREVMHEMEEQRQVQRPPYAPPAQHAVHPDLSLLIRTGIFTPALSALASPLYPIEHLDSQHRAWSRRIFATPDFSRTTSTLRVRAQANDFLRPVNWIITLGQANEEAPILIVLSPYEVNALISEIRRSRHVKLHMYTPRTTEAMNTMEDLRFHCIPTLDMSWKPPSPLDIAQLNLWAGQLYLRDFEAYETLCQTLGLVSGVMLQKDGVWDGDGFVKAKHRDAKMALLCRFERSPVPFLKILIGLRRKGMDYRATHIGRILHREALTMEDFTNETARGGLMEQVRSCTVS